MVETHLFSVDDNPLNAGIITLVGITKMNLKFTTINQDSTYVNYRHSISETDFIIPGYVFNRNDYKNFTLFSHNEHKIFFTWISNFRLKLP